MPTQIPLDLVWRRRMAAGDFIVGEANAEAVAWVDSWPDWPLGSSGTSLLLLGPSGTGKSHLAQVWCQRSGAALIKKGESLDTISAHTVLDDVDRWATTQQTELFHLLNRAKESGFSLLLCASSAIDAWSVTLPDLRSRLKALPVAKLNEPDDMLLGALLSRALVERGVTIKPDLLDYLLPRLPRSAAAISDFAGTLDQFALQSGRGLTLTIVRSFVTDSSRKL